MKLDDLAQDICSLLELLGAAGITDSSGEKITREAVFLAETTIDVKEHREMIRRDLQQHGYAVLPAGGLPLVASEMVSSFREDLARCRLSIHLVGKNYGTIPEGSTESIPEIQSELAIDRVNQGNFSRLTWIPPGLHVDDNRQQKFIEQLRMDPRIQKGSDLLETPLEDLRTVIQDRLKQTAEPVRKKSVTPTCRGHRIWSVSKQDPAQVYLIYDQRDVGVTSPWADLLFDRGFEVLRPVFEGDEREAREYHEENLRSCDGALIFMARLTNLGAPEMRTQKAQANGLPIRALAIFGSMTEAEQGPNARGDCGSSAGWFCAGSCCLSHCCNLELGEARVLFKPFPRLRPFEAEDDHVFFGREKEIDDFLRRLRLCRFLAIVGTSGSGKSSLLRAGLVPSLFSGFMVSAGSSWRVAAMRPGENPIHQLAMALDTTQVLGTEGELASTNRVLMEATLRRGTRGLIEAVRQARIPREDNLLVVVDQFEELFRFQTSRQVKNSKDEAAAFVKLLLEAAQQDQFPIYVALTMRSDFIGDCMEFPGLPEAINTGLYLVPRMTRNEVQSAITGPVAVGGGTIDQGCPPIAQ
jgi:hypothetical protein